MKRMMFLAFLAAAVFPAVLAADGFIVVPDPPHHVPGHFSFAPLEVTFHRVTVDVKDLVAVTTVDQEFFNPNDVQLEGTYLFPLPAGAHIDRFSLDINGRMMDAELLPADKARAIYEDIVRRAKDPALLEYAGRDAFKVRIFPIEPRSRKRVRITYTELLKSDAGLVEYVYPLNTEKFSSAPLEAVSMVVTLDGKQPLKTVYCPSHDADVRRSGERKAVVGWEARDAWPDTDFKVVFSRTPDPLAIDLVTHRPAGGQGTFLLMISPGFTAEKSAVQPKDICFVLDTSGSMASQKLEQARRALSFCLANLGENDRFEIVRFSTEAEPLFGRLEPVGRDSLKRAQEFVAGLKPIGGTAIDDALDRALALRGKDRSVDAARPYLVVFLTDGLPTVGETREDTIVARVKNAAAGTRIFSFGIGTDVNTHLLDRISTDTRGLSQYVLPGEDIEVKVSSFYAKIRDPVFSDLMLAFTNPSIRVTALHPQELPDLFNGDVLVVFGCYTGSGAAAVKVTGTFAGKRREFVADASFPAVEEDNAFVARLWAVRRVGWLLDEIRLHGESAELRDEVTRLAREFGIVTPYTAYLVLEDEERRNVPRDLRSFQELGDDREVLGQAKDLMDSVRKEAAAPSARSGAGAVANAQAVQELKLIAAESRAASGAGLAKSAPPAADGSGYRAAQAQNYATQVRVVNGRAFYQNGDLWTDSTAQSDAKLKNRQVRFGSDEYFTLLKRYPRAAAWFSLGSNIDVVVDDTLYQVRE
ncbi:MAG: VIT domain-containing protein [Spirochaetes bacterium]|nr:VIT domain-containing protein [Spirochaetota bacterium]